MIFFVFSTLNASLGASKYEFSEHFASMLRLLIDVLGQFECNKIEERPGVEIKI